MSTPTDDLAVGEHPSEPTAVADALLALYRERGGERYDEVVTQIQHGLQAAMLAERAGASESLVAAALLHDIGHLLDRAPGEVADDDLRHEAAGAHYLDRWFGRDVTRPIALHVAAKRYLCAVDDEYHGGLSPASVHSLELQGGPFTEAQLDAFETTSGWQDAVRLRRWDDEAKQTGVRTRALGDYRDLLTGLVRQ